MNQRGKVRSSAFRLSSVGVLLFAGIAGAQMIDTASLLRDMADLSAMAEFPNPPYTVKQFSSYDRGSKSADDQKGWFANNDCGQYLRVEKKNGRDEFVMMDTQGPGAIVRIWSANPAGNLRIYLDGSDTPAIEGPMDQILGGRFAGWPRPIAGEYSKGWNLYFPIPYARSCKVTSDKGGFYYHVNYRTYPAGANVKTFSKDDIAATAEQTKAVIQRMNATTPPQVQGQSDEQQLTISAGESVNSPEFAGPNAIVQIILSVEAENRDAALRGLVVTGTFDGEKCIECPIGDLFGSAPGINPYLSIPLGMTKDGQMISNWVMPFRQSAQFELRNTTKSDITLKSSLTMAPYKWTDSSMHFHAKWRAQFDLSTRPMIDWNYLTAKGKGVFAGVAFYIDNPVKDWWGEGDEKIYVDGETFPSHFGTGTEDYYGYAWCWPGLFTHAYHNQPRCDGPGNFGRTSINRFHILDRIPFTKDFKFDMELWHWKECKVNVAVTAYWYAQPGGTDAFKPIADADVVLRPAPELKIYKVKDAIEGEAMRIISNSAAAKADPQDWDGTSNGRQLWWHNAPKVGDVLVLGFNSPDAGKYRVVGRFLKAVDYGTHQLAINGAKAGNPIDFFNNGVLATNEVDLGVFDLKQGENQLSVTVTGANEKAVKGYMFGLDYILLKPEK